MNMSMTDAYSGFTIDFCLFMTNPSPIVFFMYAGNCAVITHIHCFSLSQHADMTMGFI